MSRVGQRVVDALGPAFRARAGAGLAPLVEGLVRPLVKTDELLRTTDRGWPAAFDLEETPDPAWIGTATGTIVPRNLTVDQQREFVRDRAAWRRGTPPAIKGAVAQLLDGTRRVDLFERDGSPWRLRVRTYSAETSVDEAALLTAAATQKPVGITLEVEVALGASYDHVEAEFATYDDHAAAYPTYDEASVHVPEEGTAP